ncbi:MAG TPA: hypothetical protein VJU87_00075 [Gemmatimonadaceae bacterium]|nr:hypothetical protein [Gemmatimonadaceae bacterium]
MDRSWERKADRWQAIGDRALVEALRAEELEALDEFITRFEPLVQRYARQLKVPAADRTHWAAELLYDVATTLTRAVGEPPGHLAAYIAGACRMRARRQRVREAQHEALMYRALEQIGASSEMAIAELCSEGSLRAARGPAWERPTLSPVLERLVSAFEEGITEEERLLLHWLSRQMSYTTIADWLGSKRSTVSTRAERLKVRLREAAMRFGSELDRAERLELARFLRRTGKVAEHRILELEQARGPRAAERGEDSAPAPGRGAGTHRVRRDDEENEGEEPR